MRGWRRAVVVLAVGVALAARPASATLLVPMSDQDLVASSDLVVIGRVQHIESALLGTNRVVTRITLGVEQALKGTPTANSVVITEPGGEVGGRRVVVFGAPTFARGERALVFLRVRRDGSLSTNALSLGKYDITEDDVARRTLPRLDARPLATFTARIAALAGQGVGMASDGRAGAAVDPPRLVAVSDAFTFTPAEGLPARWFEADCGLPITFSRANAEDSLGEEASRTALDEATAAWTAVEGASLVLGLGPDSTPTPSLIDGTFDGKNTVQFDDPFGEVEDLIGCSGVLARGGFVASAGTTFPGLRKTVGDLTFGKIFEGDVTFSQGFGECFDAVTLAEVAGHEIGHAIGFGHSSENPTEPDAVLADALMYFRAHDDGRGAAPRADDVAGLTTAYPVELLAATPLATLACEFDLGLFAQSCFNQELSLHPFTRFGKARAAAARAAAAPVAKKQKKQLKKALGFLAKTDRAIKRLSGPCAEAMTATVAHLRERTIELRAGL
jgi:hypothetical protein